MNFINQVRLTAVASAAVLVHDLCLAETVVGFARDATTQRFLYAEVHEFNRAPDGKVLTAQSRYLDAQGQEIARKSLDYRANRFIPLYKMEVPAQRYTEGIRSNADPVVVFKQDGEREEVKRLAREPGLEAADSGFNHLLMDQLPRLLQGETVSFRLIVADRGKGRNGNRRGFGSRMLNAMVKRLSGTIEDDDNQPGLRVIFAAPIAPTQGGGTGQDGAMADGMD